jgi:hypothetical protein
MTPLPREPLPGPSQIHYVKMLNFAGMLFAISCTKYYHFVFILLKTWPTLAILGSETKSLNDIREIRLE